MSELIEQTRTAPITKPVAIWRNWYRAGPYGVRFRCRCGSVTELAPRVVAGACCRRFPSKEDAEIWAASRSLSNATYLGAFLADTAPPAATSAG